MQVKKRLAFAILALVPLIVAPSLFAGVTGKIAGAIIDKKTGNQIPGANIVLVGTSMGTVSDMDGSFVILQVPPGKYSLRTSIIGYAQTVVQDVEVRIDQTSRVDFGLQPEVIKGETITIVAERKAVKADVSTSSTSILSAELTALPVSNVTGVVGMQAGVRGLDIRGSMANSSLFLVDGITMRDPRNNDPISTVPLNAVEAISIERGGFSAEYGQVQSGIVNVVTREGAKEKYQVSAEFKYSPPQAKYFGISPYDANSFWLRPYLDDQVAWNGTDAGWDKYTARQYPKFEGWNSISRTSMTNDKPNDDLSPVGAQNVFLWQHRRKPVTDQPDYDIDAGFGGPVPGISKQLGNLRFFSSYRRHREMLLIPLTRDDYVDNDLMVQVISDITPSMKLRFTAMSGARYTMLDNWVYGWDVRNPDRIVNRTGGQYGEGIFSTGWFSLDDIKYRSFAGKLTHAVSQKTYYEVSLERLSRTFYARPPARYDTTKNFEIVPGYFIDSGPFGYNPELGAKAINSMGMGGHACRYTDDTRVSVMKFKADFTSQINNQHMIKTGLEFDYNQINLFYRVLQDTTKRNDNPILAAFYVQDKMEAKGFIVNAGLRLDYSNANSDWYNVDPYNAAFFSTKYNRSTDYPTQKTKGQFQLSPRLGISHPVTENSKLFFNYGHFMQMPSYETVFNVTRSSTKKLNALGDANLPLAKTISYELGYDHSLFDNQLLIQAAAFYKDVSDQQLTVTYYGIQDISYTKTTGNGYGDIRGFELTLKKPMGRWWNGFANFTYQASKNGQFGRAQVYQDPSQQARYDQATSNLYQNRPIPQPYARVNLSFFTPSDFGPQTAGIGFMNDWMVNVLFDWQKGAFVTWNPKQIAAITFNLRSTDMTNLTLRISKKFAMRKFDVYLFADVNNTLNTKFLSYYGTINSFSDYQDQIYYSQSLHLPKNQAYDNIPGNDKYGDYRKDGVAYQPVEQRGVLNEATDTGDKGVIYWDAATKRYMEYDNTNQKWNEVDPKRIDKILKDKAYIDMPNETSFWFLNPRQIFYGVRITLNL
jgi:outer membrane receptor protein involved in Fe transport